MVTAIKKHTHVKRRIALAILAALIVAAAALLAVKFGDPLREGWQLYRQSVPNDEAVLEKADEVRSMEGYTPLEDISETYLETLLHEEDRRFYYHRGVDPIGVARSVYMNLKSGKIVQGASTITMQLSRNLFYSTERTTVRKIAEVFTAFRIERLLDKDEILELYCNEAYFGENCYGIRAAAEYYYGVEPSELDSEQSYALVYTLRAPSVYHPEPNVAAA